MTFPREASAAVAAAAAATGNKTLLLELLRKDLVATAWLHRLETAENATSDPSVKINSGTCLGFSALPPFSRHHGMATVHQAAWQTQALDTKATQSSAA